MDKEDREPGTRLFEVADKGAVYSVEITRDRDKRRSVALHAVCL